MIRRLPRSALKVGVFVVLTALMLGSLAIILGNVSFTPTRSYSALFTDATSVEPGDTVRVAGVPVGTIADAELVERHGKRYAKVDFSVRKQVPVYRNAQLQLRYANLIGKRYLAIEEQPGDATPMPLDSTFPARQTKPALNLTVLFNGFQPLFQALKPDQVNKLSYQIIKTLQGESGTIGQLLSNTAKFTRTIAGKDAVIGRVVDNLNKVLGTLDQRDQGLTQLIGQFRDLMQGLAKHRDTIDQSLPSIDSLLSATNGLLDDARAPLKTDISALGSLAGKLDHTKGKLDERLDTLPKTLTKTTRLGTYGAWFNFYLCGADATVSLLGQGIQLSTPVSVRDNDRDTVCALGGGR